MNTVALSVVICTYNRAELLRRILQNLAQQEAPSTLEVIVVDNHSTDSTQQVIEGWSSTEHFRFIPAFEEKKGHYARARNVGLNSSTGKIIAFVDDDVRVPPNWAARIVQTFQEMPDADCLGGPVEPEWEVPPPPDWVIPELFVCIGIGSLGNKKRFLEAKEFPIGANMAFRGDVLRSFGGFDPRVGQMGKESIYNDEVELITRMRQKGKKIYYDPELIVFHHVPATRVSKSYFIQRRKIDGRSIAVVEALQRGKIVLMRNLVLRSLLGIARDQSAHLATFFVKKNRHFLYSCNLAKTTSYIKTALRILIGRPPMNE